MGGGLPQGVAPEGGGVNLEVIVAGIDLETGEVGQLGFVDAQWLAL